MKISDMKFSAIETDPSTDFVGNSPVHKMGAVVVRLDGLNRIWIEGVYHGNRKLPMVMADHRARAVARQILELTKDWQEPELWKRLGLKDGSTSHPDYPRYDWLRLVNSGDSDLGYWEWVEAKIKEDR